MGHRIVHDGPIGPGFGVTSDLLSNVPEIVFFSQAFCDEYKGGFKDYSGGTLQIGFS
ncbi:MAG: hypothetical protein CM1200mP24_05670 [Gammaproteobacteria bacterium]|nr:MAG: hypothetical protein CM1200mP24_05670 [Gammaproteobacteria bacterium]